MHFGWSWQSFGWNLEVFWMDLVLVADKVVLFFSFLESEMHV